MSAQIGLRVLNPFSFGLTKNIRASDRNCERTKQVWRKYVHMRKEELKKNPKLIEKFDVLNLMLSAQEGTFDEYGIIS